jgi:NAD+ diphosphatase
MSRSGEGAGARRELPHVALSRHAHDRHGMLRTDADWLDRQWADPRTRVLVVAGSRLRAVDDRLVWVSPAEAPDGARVLLGEREGVQHFAVVVDPDDAPGVPEEWMPLRGVLPAVAADAMASGSLVLHAIGLAEWLHATQVCPRCGGELELQQAGHVLHCLACGRDQFPRSDPAVIMIVTDGEPGSPGERALLGRNAAWPENRYSTLAGFVEPGETMEDAVRREVEEETGVQVGEVTYFGSQPWPLPASLMIGFTGRAITTDIDVDGSEIQDARWFTREQMRTGAEDGSLVLPGGVSISRSLVESWYGAPLPGSW